MIWRQAASNWLWADSVAHTSGLIRTLAFGLLGTVFGPIVGAFLLTALAEGLGEIMRAFGIDIPGVKQVFYGVCLLLVVMFLPEGIWPPLSKALGLHRRRANGDGDRQ